MPVEIVIEAGPWDETALTALAERAMDATLTHLALDPQTWEATVMACDDARIAELNAGFRGKDKATNVLSWPSQERAPDTHGATPAPPEPDAFGDHHLGDIALAHETCTREAEAAGLTLNDHLTHLVIHALLHLLGYDHETDEDAALMEGIERSILKGMELHDPYPE
ncbi:MAG: rRNA maturation RNase YbeY [Rhodobacterales bacterium]|nr:MAG: rRNA maturation RNase YbeY [Rhodobacterales bacterium]